MLCYIILYYIILYYVMLYYIILYYIILYYIILYYSNIILWVQSCMRSVADGSARTHTHTHTSRTFQRRGNYAQVTSVCTIHHSWERGLTHAVASKILTVCDINLRLM